MCRYFAYRGPAAPLSTWLYDAPHSLEKQAYQPAEMVRGTINVDGIGFAWWQLEDPQPFRYVFDGPPWSDPNLPTLAPRLTSGLQLAQVRGATPGIGVGAAHVQPFVDDETRIAFTHNGWLGGFRGPVGHELLRRLPAHRFASLPTMNDSAALFCLVAERVTRGSPLADALVDGAAEVLAVCREHEQAATLSVTVVSADATVAIRTALGVPSNSLYQSVRADASIQHAAPGAETNAAPSAATKSLPDDASRVSARPAAWLLASEPLDDGAWTAVEPEHVVTLTADGIHATPL